MVLAKNFSIKKKEKTILKDITLSLSQGEVLAIVGASGAGKSTLLKALAGFFTHNTLPLQRDFNISGRIYVPNPRFGMIFQDSKSCLNPLRTVHASFMKLNTLAKHIHIDDAVIEQALCNVLLEPSKKLLYSFPSHVSGGMAQRIMLAMVLACGYDWIMADEISSSLDREHEQEIISLLIKHAKALIMVTHRTYLIKEFCTKVLVLKNGEGLLFESIDSLFESKNAYIQSLFYNSLQSQKYLHS